MNKGRKRGRRIRGESKRKRDKRREKIPENEQVKESKSPGMKMEKEN